AAARGLAVDADADQIDVLHVLREVEGADDVVGVNDLVLRRGEGGEDAEAEAREDGRVLAGGGDELDLHGTPFYHGGGPPGRQPAMASGGDLRSAGTALCPAAMRALHWDGSVAKVID